MRIRALAAAAASLLLTAPAHAAPAPGKCQIALAGEMKVEFEDNQPLIPGAINGHPIMALVDTGATSTLVSKGEAQALGLPLDDMPNVHMYGAGGNVTVYQARMKELKLGTFTAHDMRLLAAGGGRGRIGLILGQDFWGNWDVEFDLAHGTIRQLKPNRNCGEGDLAYWAKPGQAYGVAPMLAGEDGRRRVMVTVQLNGRPVHAQLDSGATHSVATTSVAARVGARDRQDGSTMRGMGTREVSISSARLDTFSVGDETIRNTRLLFGDLFGGAGFKPTGTNIARGDLDAPEMLLGADFLRSHHVLISQARRMVVFTYEGGLVFDTRPERPGTPAAPAPSVAPAATAAPAPSPAPDLPRP